MVNFIPADPAPTDQLQGRLLVLAATFLALYSTALTLAPAVRLRMWQVTYPWAHWLGFIAWAAGMAIAHRLTCRRLPARDPYLLPVAGFLTGWGVLAIWRLTPEFGSRQTLWFILGIAVLLAGIRAVNLRTLREYKYLLLTGGLLLTGLTLVLGTNPSGFGPRLWLGCCGLYFQPSEPLKLLLIIYLAAYLADRQFLISGLFPLLTPTVFMGGLTLVLLSVQQDLGTASIFLFLYTAVLFVATGKRRILIVSVILILIAGIAGYVLFDVVRLRIEAWINPWLDPSGRSYQIVQSLMAVASGGLFGRGPGLGNPTVVPVNHSDFIFAALAEETGLIGMLGMVALFALLTARGWRIALRSPDSFHRYLAIGLTTYITGQMILISGGNLRLLPLTGVTLPFISYGGSSLITSILALLILLLISNRQTQTLAPLPFIRAVRLLGGALILGLSAVALISGWWAIYRGPDLLTRTDNPRRVIADRFVLRGSLLDREETPLNVTIGEPGAYSRTYQVPALAPVLGYLDPVYGQAGLEDSLDSYLRGQDGQPPTDLWWNNLVYGQPPPGLDVRLSLDLRLQNLADEALTGQRGALVLLNAQSGEILAMASHPGFNPAALSSAWLTLVGDPDAPLINRAVQGRYPAGSALGPFLLASALDTAPLPDPPQDHALELDGARYSCAAVPDTEDWGPLIRAGCPEPIQSLTNLLGLEGTLTLFDRLGFFEQPDLRLDSGPDEPPLNNGDPITLALGPGGLRLSPLQMALAAAAVSSGGTVPPPRLSIAYNSPVDGWSLLPPTATPREALSRNASLRVSGRLAVAELRIWETTAVSPLGSESGLTWYLAGTTEGWPGTPLALALVVEEINPALAGQIGQMILTAAMAP